MKIRTALKKGTDHLINCEDDLFFIECEDNFKQPYYIGGVFDGCSTGIKSHFSSSLYSKILNKVIDDEKYWIDYTDDIEKKVKIIFSCFKNKLLDTKNLLGLTEMEILSTFIIILIKEDEYYCIVSGDGCIFIDNEEIRIESEENAPDYLSYHIYENFERVFNENIKKYNGKFSKTISICSDGLYSFRNKKINLDEEKITKEIINQLLIDEKLINSDAMLNRKYNLLIKDDFSNYDDLSIVRFIKE